jgi:excisionase family DNA binding protein
MTRIVPTRVALAGRIRLELDQGLDPWLTISEVAVITQFHKRTLQRYVDEGTMQAIRRGPKKGWALHWSVVREFFPHDTADV